MVLQCNLGKKKFHTFWWHNELTYLLFLFFLTILYKGKTCSGKLLDYINKICLSYTFWLAATIFGNECVPICYPSKIFYLLFGFKITSDEIRINYISIIDFLHVWILPTVQFEKINPNLKPAPDEFPQFHTPEAATVKPTGIYSGF